MSKSAFTPPAKTTPISRPLPNAVTYHIPHSPPPPSSTTASPPEYTTTIHLPKNSTWSSGLHWHEHHTEYLRLIQGAVYVRLDDEEFILSAKHGGVFSPLPSPEPQNQTRNSKPEKAKISNGVVTVDRSVRHIWHRASVYYSQHPDTHTKLPDDLDEEVVVAEHTSPIDIQKPLFFFNLNAIISPTPLSSASSVSERITLRAQAVRWMLGSFWVDFQLFVLFHELDNWPVFWDFGVGKTGEWFVTHAVLFVAAMLGRVLDVRGVSERRTPRGLWAAYSEEKGKGKIA